MIIHPGTLKEGSIFSFLWAKQTWYDITNHYRCI